MKPYHIETQIVYPNLKKAGTAFGILGLNEANAPSHGFALAENEPKPEIAAAQVATLADLPTENPDGSWSFKWAVRDKTAEELAQEETNRRQGMTVERWSFATAAMAAGILTAEEAQAWGPGTSLPAAVDAAITAAVSDPVQLAGAKVRALAVPRINRLNPLVEILRSAFNLTPEQADDLFIQAKALEAE